MSKIKNLNFIRIFLISILLSLLNLFKCNEVNYTIGKITILDGNYYLKDINITYVSLIQPKTDMKAKLCSIESDTDFWNYCSPFKQFYYNKWVIIFIFF